MNWPPTGNICDKDMTVPVDFLYFQSRHFYKPLVIHAEYAGGGLTSHCWVGCRRLPVRRLAVFIKPGAYQAHELLNLIDIEPCLLGTWLDAIKCEKKNLTLWSSGWKIYDSAPRLLDSSNNGMVTLRADFCVISSETVNLDRPSCKYLCRSWSRLCTGFFPRFLGTHSGNLIFFHQCRLKRELEHHG